MSPATRERERAVRQAFGELDVPGTEPASERGWDIALEVFRDREPRTATSPVRRSRLVLAAAAAGLVAVLALTPAGAKVADLIEDAFDPGVNDAKPALTGLPSGDALLVETGAGAWVVREDGSRRLLGPYDHATWSPNGLYVGASRGRQLIAAEPNGGPVHWTLSAPGPIEALDWSTDEGYRIAYVAAGRLRVVQGDGVGDREIDDGVASVTPAWQPESVPGKPVHRLAYVAGDGSVRLVEPDATDPSKPIWRSAWFGDPITTLEWSADGQALLVATDAFYTLLDAGGRSILKGTAGDSLKSITLSPDGRTIAAVRDDGPGRTELVLGIAGKAERVLRSGVGSFGKPLFSPDGAWLLAPWKAADQWLFYELGEDEPEAFSGISGQFDPAGDGTGEFPVATEWCCAR